MDPDCGICGGSDGLVLGGFIFRDARCPKCGRFRSMNNIAEFVEMTRCPRFPETLSDESQKGMLVG